MRDGEQNVILKIRSLNKIAYLKSMGVSEINAYVEQDEIGKNRVTYVFESNQQTKDILDKYYLNTELKNVLKEFSIIKAEMYKLLKGLDN